MLILLFAYVGTLESKHGAKLGQLASPGRPRVTKRLPGLIQNGSSCSSLFFTSIFLPSKREPGHTDQTCALSDLCSPSARQTWGQKSFVHRPFNPKTCLLLLGFWGQREGLRQPWPKLQTRYRVTGRWKAEPKGTDFVTVSVIKSRFTFQQPYGILENSVLLSRRLHKTSALCISRNCYKRRWLFIKGCIRVKATKEITGVLVGNFTAMPAPPAKRTLQRPIID